MMTGITSVTFRQLTPEQIIKLAAQTGLDGIEWGGDIHVPPGDIETARRVGELTREAGLKVLSYGSYYRLDGKTDAASAFIPVLESARALNAPNIRVWAGNCSPKNADDDYYSRVAAEWSEICGMAEDIVISSEYHRDTLSENADSILRLLKMTKSCDNLSTYWQPNPDITHAENLDELRRLSPYISNIHLFHWPKGARRPLAEGVDEWTDYMNAFNAGTKSPYLTKAAGHAYIMEFVLDDSPDIFRQDAAVLKTLTERTDLS